MSLVPSFVYSGVSPDLIELAGSLNHLGGGDATVSSLEVHCILVTPPHAEKKEEVEAGPIFFRSSKGLMNLRDPERRDQPASKSTIGFRVTDAYDCVRSYEDMGFMMKCPSENYARTIRYT